jgi:sec-independent protein translocase protein TatA
MKTEGDKKDDAAKPQAQVTEQPIDVQTVQPSEADRKSA